MTLVLHIGVSKTGSSAIQYGLAQHRHALSDLGVHYAIEGAEALVERRLISSGNGALLASQLNAKGRQVEFPTREAFDEAYVSTDHPISLISSESLSAAAGERLDRLVEEVIGDREVRIIAFVRDLYGHAVSSWMQRIKRHGYAGRLEAFCAKSYGNKQGVALRTYAEVFGVERMTVIHYDSLAKPVFHAFLDALGTPSANMDPPPRINRSLSKAEVEVLIACNRLHRNRADLSTRISDHLIAKHPDRPTDTVRSAVAARTLTSRFGTDVAWINDTFFAGRPVVQIGEGARATPATAPMREEVWADCVEAVGRRLASVEAQNSKYKEALSGLEVLREERARLRAEIMRLEQQSWVSRLKTDIARLRRPRRRGSAPAAGPIAPSD